MNIATINFEIYLTIDLFLMLRHMGITFIPFTFPQHNLRIDIR